MNSSRARQVAGLLLGAGGAAAGLALFLWGRAQARAREEAERLAAQRRGVARLAIRLLADPLPKCAPDAAYLFHQLDCNLESMVQAALSLVRRYPSMPLLVLNVDNERLLHKIPNGFGGGRELLKRLRAAGVAEANLKVVEWDYDASQMIHTLVEAELAVRFAKSQGWLSLLVVAPPFHLPRAAATAASAAARELPALQVFAHAGAALPWEEQAVHSQGMRGSRLEFLDAELDRIERYTKKGDIAPVEDLELRFIRHI